MTPTPANTTASTTASASTTPVFQKTLAYLVRGGYRVVRSEPGFFEAEYAGEDLRSRPPRVYVWTEDETLPSAARLTEEQRTRRAAREDVLLTHMISEMQAARDAAGYYVLPSRQGLSKEFETKATAVLQRGGRKDGGIRSAVQFFDMAYKQDTAEGKRVRSSVFGDLVRRAERRKRVAQPFFLRTGLDAGARSPGRGDLVEHLETLFRDPVTRPTLRLIDGAAGSGKTVAFEALVKTLFEEFTEAKKGQVLRGRPIVFLPEHIRTETIGYVDDVIDAMTDAEAAEPVEADQLKFLLSEGHAIWMFDGLDEFFAGDSDFFTFLGNELANPDSRAQILICTRDSLLTSSAALSGFIERQFARGAGLEIYELAPWSPEAWRDLAWLELEHGRAGAEASAKVTDFVAALEAAPEVADLARLPFYCSVLIEEFRRAGRMPADALSVIDTIFERMLTREEGKAVFRWREFVDSGVLADLAEDGLIDIDRALFDGRDARGVIAEVFDHEGRDSVVAMLAALAHERVRGGARDDAGMTPADIEVLGPLFASDGPAADVRERLATALVQFAFFGPGRRAGTIDFTHPILAEYLAGRHAVEVLRRAASAAATGSALSKASVLKGALRGAFGKGEVAAGSVFERVVARAAGTDPELATFLRSAAAAIDTGPLARTAARLAGKT